MPERYSTGDDLPPGVVTIDPSDSGWLVRIGRSKRTRRYWLSDAEARELNDLLTKSLRTDPSELLAERPLGRPR